MTFPSPPPPPPPPGTSTRVSPIAIRNPNTAARSDNEPVQLSQAEQRDVASSAASCTACATDFSAASSCCQSQRRRSLPASQTSRSTWSSRTAASSTPCPWCSRTTGRTGSIMGSTAGSRLPNSRRSSFGVIRDLTGQLGQALDSLESPSPRWPRLSSLRNRSNAGRQQPQQYNSLLDASDTADAADPPTLQQQRRQHVLLEDGVLDSLETLAEVLTATLSPNRAHP